MKALLSLFGLIFVVAGAAVGVVSQMDYGNALIGLNLGLAATLLVGGFIVLGLSGVIGAISRMADEMPRSLPSQRGGTTAVVADHVTADKSDMPFPAATAAVGAVGATAGAAGLAMSSAFDKTTDGVDAAVDKVAEVANEAKEKASDIAENVADKAGDVVEGAKDITGSAVDKVAEAAKEAEEKASQAAGNAKDAVAETAEDATTAVADKTEEVKDAVADADASDDQPDAEASDTEAPKAEDGDDDEEDADELYVVEEVEIRGKPARVLSDNTVEAETDEGWMRFENIEHLEEYLDAMGS